MNITIITSRTEIEGLLTALEEAHYQSKDVRVAIDGGLKIKIGGGMWSPPLGQPDNS